MLVGQPKYKDKTGKEHEGYITITFGMRGWFAVHMWWNNEREDNLPPFWEPYNSADFSYKTPEEAIQDAITWAWSEEMLFTHGDKEIDFSLPENQTVEGYKNATNTSRS